MNSYDKEDFENYTKSWEPLNCHLDVSWGNLLNKTTQIVIRESIRSQVQFLWINDQHEWGWAACVRESCLSRYNNFSSDILMCRRRDGHENNKRVF